MLPNKPYALLPFMVSAFFLTYSESCFAKKYWIGKGYEISIPTNKCALELFDRTEAHRFWRVSCKNGEYFAEKRLPIRIRYRNDVLEFQPDSDYQIISEPMDLDGDGKPELYIGDMSQGTNRAYTDTHKIILNKGKLLLLDIPVAGLRFKKVKGRRLPLIIAMDALRTCGDMVHGEPFVEYVIKFEKGKLVLDESMTYSDAPLKPSKLERLEGYNPQTELKALMEMPSAIYWTFVRCEIQWFEAAMAYRGYPELKTKWSGGQVVGIAKYYGMDVIKPPAVVEYTVHDR